MKRCLLGLLLVLLGPLSSCGGGQGGCVPPCGRGEVCCDFKSGKRCVAPERCS